MTDPLFDIAVPAPELIECRHCDNRIATTVDGARFLGWHIFEGQSIGGKAMLDVICPPCFSGRSHT